MRTLILCSLLLCTLLLPAQRRSLEDRFPELPYKGRMSFYWGYNRAMFSRSDIHFHGPQYDFTLYGVTARDRPTRFNFNDYFNPVRFTIPQFNIRAGYALSEHWSITLGYDHMKYVMDTNQIAVISGVIAPETGSPFAGTYLRDTIAVHPRLATLEHTDGLNNVTLDLEHAALLARLWRGRLRLRSVLGVGGIFVVPRSEVKVLGNGLNNDYHVAGYSMSAQAGLRLEFMGRWFVQATARGGWISLPAVLVANAAPELADQSFSFLEGYGAVGAYIRLKRKP